MPLEAPVIRKTGSGKRDPFAFQNGGVHDRAKIHVEAGAGGNGCLSFRREAHVPRGGPDGGDGGRGGDVVIVCDGSLRDLQSFRRRSHFNAGRGGHGGGGDPPRAAAGALEISVAPRPARLGTKRPARW